MNDPPRQRTAAIFVALCVAIAGALGVTVVYGFGGQPQLEGLLLGLALGGLAMALIVFGRRMLPGGHFVQVRDEHPEDPVDQAQAAAAFESGAEPIERRSLILKFFGVAVGALGLAALFPVRSLGTRPGLSLFHTHWRRGLRAVTHDGRPVHLEDVDVDTVLTVFPEGTDNAADSQTLLIRLPPSVPPPGPAGSSVGGVVAFSKICTHAGCPVGLYQADTQELFCPCHQSTFNVRDGAKPTFGPAARALPQLPIATDAQGFIIAQGDFPEPVGPGFWSRPRA